MTPEKKKDNLAEWYRTILAVVVSVLITISVSLLQHSKIEGATETRIETLEKCSEDLKKSDATANEKLDIQLEKIHKMELNIIELKTSGKYQEEILLDLRKAITGK
jgi:hypothetical protein